MSLKIFLGVKEYAGFYRSLHQGFLDAGLHANLYLYASHPFHYGEAENKDSILRVIQSIYRYRRHSKSIFLKLILISVCSVFKLVLLLRIARKYDCLILSASSNIFCSLDLLILKKFLAKRIIVTCHGSDVRSPYLDAKITSNFALLLIKTLRVKIRVRIIEKYADEIINDLGMSGFFKRKLVGHRFLGLPTDMCNRPETSYKIPNRKIKILHCPSNTDVKGTAEITDVMRRLVTIFPDKISFDTVKGVTHDKLIERIDEADLVVDQLYSDIYMATLAVECCWRKTPVIVGNVISKHKWDTIYRDLLGEIPNIFIEPSGLEECLRSIIDGNIDLASVAEEQYKYVSHWTPKKIAYQYKKIILSETPENYLFVPDTGNEFGIGLSQTAIEERKTEYKHSWGWGIGLK